MHRIVVNLLSRKYVYGEPYVMDMAEVQKTIQRFLDAEGQGSLVIDCGERGWTCIPTRSIDFITIEPFSNDG